MSRPKPRETLMSLGDQIIWALRTYIGETLDHVPCVFPSSTARMLTFTSHVNVNTWSDWTEITDDGAQTLSEDCSTTSIRIFGTYLDPSVTAYYQYEIAYGDSKEVVHRGRFDGKSDIYFYIIGKRIPGGETVYYRMMDDSGGGNTVKFSIFYYCCS